MTPSSLVITRVFLENIKSYERADVSLPEGTIAICGPNGAGKSTLIEAIGFALFGSQRVKQAQLVREGAAHGRIEVSFTSGFDGLPYTVVREVKREGASAARLHGDAHDLLVASGVKDVQAELFQHLGAGSGVSVDVLFEGVIGVPQGQLIGDFLLSAAPRRARFEELLALQEFNTVYQRLAGPLGWGRDRHATSSGRLAALAERILASQDVRQALVELQAQLGAVRRRSAGLHEEHERTVEERRALDQAEEHLRLAHTRRAAAEAGRQLAAERLIEAERRWRESADAATTALATRPGHDLYQSLDATVSRLEQDRAARDDLRRQYARTDTELARLEASAEGVARRLETVAQAEAAADRLRPQVARQADLESTLERLERRVALRDDLQSRLHARQKHELALAERLEQLTERAGAAPEAEAEVATAAALLDQTRIETGTVAGRAQALAAQIEAQRGAEEAILRGEQSVCPVCRRPFEQNDAASFLEHLRAEMAEGERALADLRERQAELERSSSAQQRSHRQALARLEEARQASAALTAGQEELRRLVAEREEIAALLDELAALDDDRALAAAHLTALGDPRAKLHAAEAVIAERLELNASRLRNEAAMQAVSQKRAALDQQLAAYAELDSRLAEAANARDATRHDYDTYRQLAPLAAELDRRLAELNRLRAALAEAEAERQGADRALSSAEEAYDAARHTQVRQRERELDINLARVDAEVQETDRRLGEAAERLSQLESLEAEHAALVRSAALDRRALELLAFLRDTIRRAGPEIARLVLARVSQSAAITYSELMGDHASTVAWGDDYGITVERAGQTRDFVQLSGGEQVAAALAVRLALLREVSDIRIAFFDEPTINLDEDRRRSLAEQIRAIRDLDQLLVISHDDSLESVTDNVIRVRKEHGHSLLEMA